MSGLPLRVNAGHGGEVAVPAGGRLYIGRHGARVESRDRHLGVSKSVQVPQLCWWIEEVNLKPLRAEAATERRVRVVNCSDKVALEVREDSRPVFVLPEQDILLHHPVARVSFSIGGDRLSSIVYLSATHDSAAIDQSTAQSRGTTVVYGNRLHLTPKEHLVCLVRYEAFFLDADGPLEVASVNAVAKLTNYSESMVNKHMQAIRSKCGRIQPSLQRAHSSGDRNFHAELVSLLWEQRVLTAESESHLRRWRDSRIMPPAVGE